MELYLLTKVSRAVWMSEPPAIQKSAATSMAYRSWSSRAPSSAFRRHPAIQSRLSQPRKTKVDCLALDDAWSSFLDLLNTRDCWLNPIDSQPIFRHTDVRLAACLSRETLLTHKPSCSVHMAPTRRPASDSRPRRQFYRLEGQTDELPFSCKDGPGINVYKAFNGDTQNLEGREDPMFEKYGKKVTYIVRVSLD